MPAGVGGYNEPFGAPGTCFCRYFFHWRPTEKTRKKHLLPERPKILKIRRPGDLWSHFGRFLDPFWVLLPEKINVKTGNGKDQENHQK